MCGTLHAEGLSRVLGVWPIDMQEHCILQILMQGKGTDVWPIDIRVSTIHLMQAYLACLGVVYLIHSVGTGTYIIGIQRRQGAGCVAY